MRRREFLAALAAPALVGLTRKTPTPLAGGFVDDAGAAAHRWRDGLLRPFRGAPRRVPIVIVGGGIGGLSAAWELLRRDMREFVLLEQEREVGGNARGGENAITAFPWAAHYVPLPDERATLVRELFAELGMLRDGEWDERHRCFSPQERIFIHGEWRDGLAPEYAAGPSELRALDRFHGLIAEARASGRFRIPMEPGGGHGHPLDRETMAEWLARHGVDAPVVRWIVDYATRDDYGARVADVSAWAGVHYFASRGEVDEAPLTWPEGNARVSRHLAHRCREQTRTGEPAVLIERAGTRWLVRTERAAFLSDAVIYAAPMFAAPYVCPELRSRMPALTYSPWLTANLVLDRWPRESGRGAPVAWDNVMFDSRSLGYVVATHQSLATHHPRTVWTYYLPLADHAPQAGRRLLASRSWEAWCSEILDDLERAHPDIRGCVSRIDIMRMGHAMIRPVPGNRAAVHAARAAAPPGFFFGSSDASGLPLFEEAQYRGVMAARVALDRLG